MKKLLSLAVLAAALNAGSAFALPILNANTPGAETVTVFPDHSDPNLYYTAPTVFTISKNEAGVPNFSYIEYLTSGYRRAFIQATLRPNFTYSEMEKAKQNILAINPAARFTALPFEKASVSFTDSLKVLMVESDCRHPAGTVGDEQTCAFHLRNQGVKVLRPMLKKGLAITTQFVYTINGVRQNADGTYVNQVNTYQVAGRIGGPDLAAHPELFQDYNGNVIKNLLPGISSFLERNADVTAMGLTGSANMSIPYRYGLIENGGVPELHYERTPDRNEGVLSFVVEPHHWSDMWQAEPLRVEIVGQPGNALYRNAQCLEQGSGRFACQLTITDLGRRTLKRMRGSASIPFSLSALYTVSGKDGQELTHAVRVSLDSEYFKAHPIDW